MEALKWIKITTDIFDDEKILLIESLPDADSLIVIWFKLLCLAGKQNNSGVFMINDRIPYTDKMLATIFRRKESTVQLALKTFEDFGMVEIVNGVITIPNWGKHQNLDKIESRNEYMREYMRKRREQQRALTEGKVNSKVNVNPLEEDIEKDIDIDLEEETEIPAAAAQKTDYKQIISLYHELCPSFPQIRALSDARKTAIRARLRQYSVEDFGTMFMKAEASDFLKGRNARNWSATFDWLLNGNNFAKVLDGNYDNKDAQTKVKTEVQTPENYDADLEAWLSSQK